MAHSYKTKPGATENEIIFEQCTLDRWCEALDSFIQHVGFPGSYHHEGTRLMSRNGEFAKQETLIYRVPAKKGNFIVMNFCPFCGGCVNPKAHTLTGIRKGETKVTTLTVKYEPFTDEDYAPVESKGNV